MNDLATPTKRGRPRTTERKACGCTGACSAVCRTRRSRARRLKTLDEEAKKRIADRRDRQCGCGRAHTNRCRARRFRKEHPEIARRYRIASQAAYTAAAVQRDDLILERRAMASIRTALRRGTIVPPHACDGCGVSTADKARLRPLLPNPHQPRHIAWLCPLCANRISEEGGEVVLSWTWPGVAGEVPRPWWRISIPADAVAAANAAVADAARDGRVRDPRVMRQWTDVLFDRAGLDPERIYPLARRHRPISHDRQVDAMLWWWADLERDQRARRAHNDRDLESESIVTVAPRRARLRRTTAGRALPVVDAIGIVPVEPPRPAPAPVRPPKRSIEEEDAMLERIDASLAGIDALLARISPPKKKPPAPAVDD